MADTTQMTNAGAAPPRPQSPPTPTPRSDFAVAFLRGLNHRNFTPAQLATAIARCGYGKLVRADYAPCGIFAYIAHTTQRIHTALAAQGGTKVMTKSAHGPYTCIHLLPAHGWSRQGREGGPKVLTRGVHSYDIECPDAGEGSWANWESKVQILEISSEGEGFAGLIPDPLVEMLRERRWPQPLEPVEPSKSETVLVMAIEYDADTCGVCDTSIYEVPRDWVDDKDEGGWLIYRRDPYCIQKPEELPNSHRCWRRLNAAYLNDKHLDDADREAIKKVWPEIPEELPILHSGRVFQHLTDGRPDADFKGRPIFCIFKIGW